VDVPPPLLVAIVGPPQVGKSTLLRCLVRNYVRQSITQITGFLNSLTIFSFQLTHLCVGPVTVVTSKKRRVTFFEVPNDVNAMVDAAKVADLVGQMTNVRNRNTISFIFQVLILIDAAFGFEMEVFEFINICQVHGMPKVMGVLTHMDQVKKSKLKSLKKKLKQRFWAELYPVGLMRCLPVYLLSIPFVGSI
jgi:ribosome biogenesis protein BMS1